MNTDERVNKAVQNFGSGYNCSQAVLTAFCDLFDMPADTGLAIAAGFGAGIGGLQKTCGAVSGAVMLIGLRFYDADDVSGSKRLVYEKVRDFVAKFDKRSGSSSCRDILGVDLSTEEGAQKARDEGLFEKICGKAVQAACELVAEFIL